MYFLVNGEMGNLLDEGEKLIVEGKGIIKYAKGSTYFGGFSNSKRQGKVVLDTNKLYYE